VRGGVSIAVRGLTHAYRSGRARLIVLDRLDLNVEAGGYVSIRGPSGAGKSTLLTLLGGLERPQQGDLLVGEVNLAGLAGDELARYRRDTVGFVFQHFGLLGTLSARENVELACSLAGVSRKDRRERAATLLDAVGLSDRVTHRPGQLSGGERQRVALARALANFPRLILADEPTGNLDEEAGVRVIEELERLRADRGATLVLVTHNRRLAERAGQQLSLEGGRLIPA
jgi:putative ABC transport system ATP-binding protein